ncbi:hypothetical protein [Luteolibacter sp. LG18]|uniref:hypothetical protein n=1 Tax=Luteolibacter sp. LG18 TaxID=2819286 RepID=UPI002B281157|nr:hypothetical protein llg_01260 [Luteolibacter sp. LG18]
MRRLALLFALASCASAQEQMIREVIDTKTDTHVEITALFSGPAPRGYLPVRVKMANRLESNRSVTLSFDSTASSYGYSYGRGDGGKMSSSFTFDAPAEKNTEHDILVPLPTVITSDDGSMNVSVRLSGSMGAATNSISAQFGDKLPAVLLGENLYTANASELDKEIASRSSGRSGRTEFASKFDARMMPDDWRAYSGYDSILMTDAEWTASSPGAKNAVVVWTRLGGQLVIYTDSASLASLGLPDDSSYGSITLARTAGALKLDAAKTVDLVTKKPPVPAQLTSLNGDYSSSWPLQHEFGQVGFNYAVFIVILIAFGVIVGPVNLFVFAKTGRRHRLFITTPLISLAASLILVLLILIQDGFGGRGARAVLMEVRPDRNENAAYLHQEQFSRTGVLTGARFTLQEPAAISPVPLDSDNRWARLTLRNGGSDNGYAANFVDGKLETSGDWFQSRSEQGQILDSVVPTRGRIELSGSGTPVLLSTFEFPIETLYYQDAAKKWWKATNLQPGAKVTPTSVSDTEVKNAVADESRRFGARHRAMLTKASIRPGTFVAVTNSAPGVETYKSIKWQSTRTVITGPAFTP